MFKNRVHSPNKKDAVSKTKAHISYIARRPGVMFNDGMTHGLFGKVQGMEGLQDIENLKNVKDYIGEKTKAGTITYRSVISLNEKDALRLGFDKRTAWKELLEENMYSIAEKMGVPPSRLEYVAAVHADKGHPHVHIVFWDKEQPIKEAFIHEDIPKQIRADLTKKVFENDLTELYKEKNNARDDLNSAINSVVGDLQKLNEFPENVYGSMMNNRFSKEFLEELATDLQGLRGKLLPRGSLKMAYLPPELKEETKNIIKKLINNNEDFNRHFNKYIDSSVKTAELYTTYEPSLDKVRKNAEDEIYKRLCNGLLKTLKDQQVKEYINIGEDNDQIHKTEAMFILTGLFSLLSRNSEANKNKYINRKGELSKEAKIEQANKKRDTSYLSWGD